MDVGFERFVLAVLEVLRKRGQMINIAALGDLHCEENSKNAFKLIFKEINRSANVLAIPGDLTATGRLEEANVLIEELSVLTIPVVVVLGNHDYQSDREGEISRLLRDNGIQVLDGDVFSISINGKSVGFTGCKGMLGGFDDTSLPNFGERILKELFDNIRSEARKVEMGLSNLETEYKVVLIHYSPIRDTLVGENVEIYAYLGSSLPCMWIDAMGADLVLHGHSHFGIEEGETPGGIAVRNVALPVIGRSFRIYQFG